MKSKPKIGDKVILYSLLREGGFEGEIISVNSLGYCTVKILEQNEPITGVMYYDKEPNIIYSSLWQICYPMK